MMYSTKPTKIQLAGLALITGLTMATAFGCQKTTLKPDTKSYRTQGIMGNPGDSVGMGGSGEQDGPKFPPH